MKKISFLLTVVMLLSVFTVFASADTNKFDRIGDTMYFRNLRYTIAAGEVTELFDSGEKLCVVDAQKNPVEKDKPVPNGSYVVSLDETAEWDELRICIMEDINCDGKVTAADARLALRCGAQLETLSEIQLLAGDVTGDGRVTAADARLILRKPAGIR